MNELIRVSLMLHLVIFSSSVPYSTYFVLYRLHVVEARDLTVGAPVSGSGAVRVLYCVVLGKPLYSGSQCLSPHWSVTGYRRI